jgi:hypothetical protein
VHKRLVLDLLDPTLALTSVERRQHQLDHGERQDQGERRGHHRLAQVLPDELRAGRSQLPFELLADLQAAVHTLAKRSGSLMRFVHSYRELTQMPPPALAPLSLPDYLRRVERLFAAEWGGRGGGGGGGV